MKTYLTVCSILFVGILSGLSQGFINLNFESAVINTSGAPQFAIVASNAIPGWTAYINGVSQTYITYNTVTLSAAMVGLEGTNNDLGFPAVEAKYFILIGGSRFTTPANAAIGQTGQIPISAASLVFWGNIGNTQITFNNQPLSFQTIGSTGNYAIYGADISPYAGQTGELLFTAPFGTSGIFDNIQFSITAVPEPSQFTLAALGVLLLGLRRWKKWSRP